MNALPDATATTVRNVKASTASIRIGGMGRRRMRRQANAPYDQQSAAARAVLKPKIISAV